MDYTGTTLKDNLFLLRRCAEMGITVEEMGRRAHTTSVSRLIAAERKAQVRAKATAAELGMA